MKNITQLQIGKNGLSESFIQTLKGNFERCQTVKISVLKSVRENKKDVQKFADEILKKLGDNYTARIIGFVIVVKRWRRAICNSKIEINKRV